MTESQQVAAAAPSPSLPRRLLSGALAAAFIGVLWGACESLARLLFYVQGDQEGIRAVPDTGLVDSVGIIVLSGLEYAVVGAVVGVLAVLLLAPALRLVCRGRDVAWRAFVAPRFAMWFAVVFCNLYWWTRFFIPFARSQRFYSPRRLLLAALFAVVALVVAVAVVRMLLHAKERLAGARAVSLGAVALLAMIFLVREQALLAKVPTKQDAAGRHNVVLFVIDALRASQLGCYGYHRDTSPRIDAIAREGTLFERAVVQAPYTWTSFGTLFTGKYPRRHGLMKMDPTVRFDPKMNATLQVILDATGYRTGAFLTGMLSNASGLIHGFQTYFESSVGRDPVRRSSLWTFYRSELVLRAAWNKVRHALSPSIVADEAVKWIRANKDGRFLAVIHLYPTHTPYDPPEEYDIFSPGYQGPIDKFTHDMSVLIATDRAKLMPADVQRITDLYDGGVRFADAMVGEVLDVLQQEGVLDETVVAITADHGEELGEHGVWEHNWMYNTNQLVPLIVRMPDGLGAGRRVDVPVEYTDVLPTLLDLVGLPIDRKWDADGFDGESLKPWFEGQRPRTDDFAFCENNYYVSVQNKDWKLIRSKEYVAGDPPRLYHLAVDPGEMVNVHDREPAVVDLLNAEWEKYNAVPMPHPTTRPVDPLNKELLQQLGYTGSDFTHGISVREGEKERERTASQSQGGSNAREPEQPHR